MVRRLWPVVPLLALAGLFYALGLHRYLSLAALARDQAALRQLAVAQPVLAPVVYVLVYVATAAVSLPSSAPLSVAAGVMFGLATGTVYAVTGGELGAIAAFLLVRHVCADLVERRAGHLLHRMRPGLERDGFSYLLALRLLPVLPFWLVNLAPPLVGMRLAPYAAATLIGIVPMIAVFAALGAGFGDALATGHKPDLWILVSPEIILPLTGLSALALLPVCWRAWKTRNA